MNIEATPIKCKSDTYNFLVIFLKHMSMYLTLLKKAY